VLSTCIYEAYIRSLWFVLAFSRNRNHVIRTNAKILDARAGRFVRVTSADRYCAQLFVAYLPSMDPGFENFRRSGKLFNCISVHLTKADLISKSVMFTLKTVVHSKKIICKINKLTVLLFRRKTCLWLFYNEASTLYWNCNYLFDYTFSWHIQRTVGQTIS